MLWFCYFASKRSLFLSNCYVTQLCSTLWDPIDCSTRSSPVLHYLLEFAQVHVHWVNDAIQPVHPLLPASSPAFKFSQYQVFSNELALCIKWPKHWNFSFSLSLSSENSGLISFRIEKSNNKFSFLIVSSQMDNHYYTRKYELTIYWDKGSPQVINNKASVEGQICSCFSSNSKGPHSLMQWFQCISEIIWMCTQELMFLSWNVYIFTLSRQRSK